MLGCDNYEKKNMLKISAQSQPDVMNGTDSYEIEFGSHSALTCGAAIFAQYSANLYNIVLLHKADETWSLVWNQTSDGVTWTRLRISPNVGCPAPQTSKTASVIFENNINQAKVVELWRGNDGIYLSNGQPPFKVSGQIDNVFDQTKTPHVNQAMVSKETAFVDKHKLEYHWLWASGSSTTLDKEYVLDLRKWSWFEIDRGTGKQIQLGVDVVDTIGNQYTYGFLETGYMERLENGTDFDGTAITSTMAFGDQLLVAQNLFITNSVVSANLIAVAKNTNSTVTLTHYLDGATTGTDKTLSLADASHRYANSMVDVYSAPAIFHGFKLVHTSSSESKGLEPLYFAVYFQKVREHTR
jgi:hypothetical protein